MRINLHVIQDELPSCNWKSRILEQNYDEVCSYPRIYTGGPAPEDCLLIVSADRITDTALRFFKNGATLLVIGRPSLALFNTQSSFIYTETAVTLEVMLNNVSEVFHKYNLLERRMQQIVDDRKPMRELAITASTIIKNGFYAQTPGFRALFLYIPYIENPSELFKEYRNNPFAVDNEILTGEDINMMMSDPDYMASDEATVPTLFWGEQRYGYRSLFYNIRIQDELVARVLIDEVNEPLKDRDFLILKQLGDFIKKIFLTNPIAAYEQPDNLDTVLKGLLTHTLLPETEIKSVMRHYNWGIDDEYICMILNQKQMVQNINTLTPMALYISQSINNTCYTIFNNSIIFICNLTRAGVNREGFLAPLKTLLRDNLMTACISMNFFDFKELYYYYTVTLETYQFAKDMYPTRWYFMVEDYQFEYLLRKYKKGTVIDALIPEGLKRLMEHDKKKSGDYTELLRIYLDHERNVAETIREAYIHRNTFQYRLERLQEILGMDLDLPENRILLQLAFRLMDKTK